MHLELEASSQVKIGDLIGFGSCSIIVAMYPRFRVWVYRAATYNLNPKPQAPKLITASCLKQSRSSRRAPVLHGVGFKPKAQDFAVWGLEFLAVLGSGFKV